MIRSRIFIVIIICIITHEYRAFGQDTIRRKKVLFSGTIGSSFVKTPYWDLQQQKMATGIKSAVALSTNFNLPHDYHLTLMFFYYIKTKSLQNMPWLPDYALMVTRDKYLPNTFFWGYSNFGNNKYSNSLKTEEEAFAAGTFFTGYRIKVPTKVMNLVKIDSSSNLITYMQINYTCRYFNKEGILSGGVFDGKPIFVYNINYTLLKGIYVNLSLLYYLRSSTKMPWDSDYSYGFGIVNGKPWRATFTYANTSNKFPWSSEKIDSGFLHGIFSVAFSYVIDYRTKVKKKTVFTPNH